MKIKLAAYILTTSGIVIILTLLYLRTLTRARLKAILDLIDMNENLGYDLHAFLESAQPLLERVGIEELSYRISYTGVELEKEKPTKEGRWLTKSITKKGYSIDMAMLPRINRGEFAYINALILEVFALMVKVDIEIKMRSLSETFAKLGRIKTFIRHDMKNIAQFIKALSFNIESVETEKDKERLFHYLKDSMPHLLKRAERILNTMEEEKEEGKIKIKSLKETVDNIASLIGLKVRTTGDATCPIPWKLQIAIENILKNIHEKALREKLECTIHITEGKDSVVLTVEDTGSPMKNPERVFEPFYTTKKGGLGIGLYQAKTFIEDLGGALRAENTERGVRFTVTIPKKP